LQGSREDRAGGRRSVRRAVQEDPPNSSGAGVIEGESGTRTFDPTRESSLELKAFLEFRERGRVPLRYGIPLGLRALVCDVPLAIVDSWPGPIGMKLRELCYRIRFGEMGTNVLIGKNIE